MTRAVAALAAFAALAGCGGDDGGEAPVVFAAASVADVAQEVDPDATVVAGGSNDLAAQLRDGAAADLILSASASPLDELRSAGLVEQPVVFASNRLVIIVPAESPGAVTHLSDLTGDGVQLVLGAEGVPVGDYARELLEATGLGAALDNVVSLEDDVKGVVGKVALGEADAGIVYATDAGAAGDDVRTVPVSERFQPDVRYYAAVVSPASEAAKGYLDRLLGDEGRRALSAAGFLAAPP